MRILFLLGSEMARWPIALWEGWLAMITGAPDVSLGDTATIYGYMWHIDSFKSTMR